MNVATLNRSTATTLDRNQAVIEEIRDLNWSGLTNDDLLAVSHAYYYFSVQFREALEIARDLYPTDPKLIELYQGECDTDNLSPCAGVAEDGERMNHDEFMRRVVSLSSLDRGEAERLTELGREYLGEVHKMDRLTRAMSLSSYEDGGLETVFGAILTARNWDGPSLNAFRHFLVEHIRLDSGEHGALCRHLVADDRILPLWTAFRDMLVAAAPRLAA